MMGRPSLDLRGRTFGRITVIRRTKERINFGVAWACICSCEPEKEILIKASALTTGQVQSCGCLNIDLIKARSTTHGATVNRKPTPIYSIWQGIKKRCDNPKSKYYADYGGRGIKYDSTWKEFETFRDYVLKLPNCPDNVQIAGTFIGREIDRYPDKNGDYRPGNVRWATRSEQMNNVRTNRLIKVNGVLMTFKQAAERYGKAPYQAILKRVNRGWSYKKAFSTPSGVK